MSRATTNAPASTTGGSGSGPSSQASGITRPATKTAAIATVTPIRTSPVSARDWLPTQANADHDHHSSRTRRIPSASVSAEIGFVTNVVILMIANTKTRSKKTSNVVTR